MGDLPNKAYYRPKEVAEYFDVSVPTIYLWIDTGKLEAEKIADSTIRITRDAIENLKKPVIS